jgi:hypothetical protein
MAQLSLRYGGSVVNPSPLESLTPLDFEFSVLGAGGYQEALGRDGVSASRFENRVSILETQARGPCGDGEVRAKLVSLLDGAIG